MGFCYSLAVMPHKKNLTATSLSLPVQLIERRIYLIRGQKVMIDSDLAELYGVTTSRLNEQVTRNRKRFPGDFMFRLTTEEAKNLRSQIVISRSDLRSQFATSNAQIPQLLGKNENLRSHFAISSSEHGGRRYLPFHRRNCFASK